MTRSANQILIQKLIILCKSISQIRGFFWSVFSRIWKEYGEIRSISPYSVRMRENADRKKLRIWTLFTQWVLFKMGRWEDVFCVFFWLCQLLFQWKFLWKQVLLLNYLLPQPSVMFQWYQYNGSANQICNIFYLFEFSVFHHPFKCHDKKRVTQDEHCTRNEVFHWGFLQ